MSVDPRESYLNVGSASVWLGKELTLTRTPKELPKKGWPGPNDSICQNSLKSKNQLGLRTERTEDGFPLQNDENRISPEESWQSTYTKGISNLAFDVFLPVHSSDEVFHPAFHLTDCVSHSYLIPVQFSSVLLYRYWILISYPELTSLFHWAVCLCSLKCSCSLWSFLNMCMYYAYT